MNENEKKYLIDIVQEEINKQTKKGRTKFNSIYYCGFEDACNEIIRIIVEIEADEESNLEKYKKEIIENFERLRQTTTYDCAFTGAIQSVYDEYNDKQICTVEELLNWLCEVKFEKYKISKIEFKEYIIKWHDEIKIILNF